MRFSQAALFGSCAIVIGAGCGETLTSSLADSQKLIPSTTGFSIHGTVLANTDVSTITRGNNDLGILASDEGAVVQVLSFSEEERTAVLRKNHQLVEPADMEIDIEASTFLDGWFFVTGSHGVAKKKGTFQEPRTRFYRFRLDSDANMTDLQEGTFSQLLATDPTLAPHHKQPLQQNGLNIEGLAARDGHLYIGLRSPNIDGNAIVLRVLAETLFSEGPPTYDLLKLPIGSGLGIRAMAPFRDGFLLIAGNAGSEASKDHPVTEDYREGRPSELISWNPESGEIARHGIFPRIKKGKEEALLVLAEGTNNAPAEVLVLYDSIKNGGALTFAIDIPVGPALNGREPSSY